MSRCSTLGRGLSKRVLGCFSSEGFKEAAEKFQVESGIEPECELDALDERIRIREAVQNGHIETAIRLVNALHPELFDKNRYLYFHLQVRKRTSSIIIIVSFFSGKVEL